MLAQSIRFEGWDVSDWLRLLSLFEGPQGAGDGGLFVLHDGREIHKLLHARVGRLDPAGQAWGKPLDQLAGEHGAAWVVALHVGALEELLDRLAGRINRDDDLLDQALKALEIARDLSHEGAIASWPARLPTSLPSAAVIRSGVDAICPPHKSAVVGLFEHGELWTSLVLVRGIRNFELALGPEDLRREIGLLSGDFRRDYWHLMKAAERRVGPLHLGLFTEVKTFRRLVAEGRAGSWARAVAVRDVVVSPMSAAIALPLGIDAARGLARSTAVSLGRAAVDQRILAAITAVRDPDRRGDLFAAIRRFITRMAP